MSGDDNEMKASLVRTYSADTITLSYWLAHKTV